MRKTIFTLIALLVLSTAAFAQKFTEEEFMKKYSEKTGMDKFNNIKTLIIEGETQIMTDKYPFRLFFKAPNHLRMKERYNNDYTYKIISGSTRKVIGSEGRQIELSQLETDMMQNIMNFTEGFLINYKKNGFKIEYLGLDTLNKTTVFRQPPRNVVISPEPNPNREPFDINKIKIDTLLTAVCYKIKVSTPMQKDYIMKVDTTSMNILWSSGNPFIYADIASIKFNLYENFGGVSFPIHIVVESQFIPSTIRISSIKVNETFPDSYFDPNSEDNKVIKEQ